MTIQLNEPAPEGAGFLARTAVVIPALNEAACVTDTVLYWRRRGVALVRVVDNGSTDATAARLWGGGVDRHARSARAHRVDSLQLGRRQRSPRRFGGSGIST